MGMKKSRLYKVTLLAVLMMSMAMVAVVIGQFVPAGMPKKKAPPVPKTPKKSVETAESGVAPSPRTATVIPYDEATVEFSSGDFGKWGMIEVEGKSYRVSPVISFMRPYELNHHRVQVDYSGSGSVEVIVAHYLNDDLKNAAEKPKYRSRPQQLTSGQEILVSSNRRAERCAWLLLRTIGNVQVTKISHRCWRGLGALYGHVAREFDFAGAKLHYRLMMPRNYDPSKSYPLVVNVHGSGGVGTDNVKNMEMVILGTALFTKYFHDKEFECFSIVPQITPQNEIPAPYYPQGTLGAPTPAHPDTPLVNEQGWYTQASLSLIQTLMDDEGINVDANRVYFAGFSYGGKACWEFLKAGPDVFAAAVCGAGWPIGRVAVKPQGPLLVELKREVQRYKHVPVFIFVGGEDAMRFGSRAVHEEMLAQGGKSRYAEYPQTKHIFSAGKAWGKRDNIVWLFQQRRNPGSGDK